MAPCARDGAWQIRGEATRRQLTHFSVIIQPAKRGLGSNQAFLFKSILELEAKPATIFPGLDASITSASFGGGSVFRRAEGTSAVTVRGRWMRPPVCRETSVPIPTSLNHLVSRKTLFFFFDSLLPRFFPFRGTALLFVSSAKQRYFGGPTEWFRVTRVQWAFERGRDVNLRVTEINRGCTSRFVISWNKNKFEINKIIISMELHVTSIETFRAIQKFSLLSFESFYYRIAFRYQC